MLAHSAEAPLFGPQGLFNLHGTPRADPPNAPCPGPGSVYCTTSRSPSLPGSPVHRRTWPGTHTLADSLKTWTSVGRVCAGGSIALRRGEWWQASGIESPDTCKMAETKTAARKGFGNDQGTSSMGHAQLASSMRQICGSSTGDPKKGFPESGGWADQTRCRRHQLTRRSRLWKSRAGRAGSGPCQSA